MSDSVTDSVPRIVVLGSVNMDIVAATAVMPAPGETVLGNSLLTQPGGKGANQAIAAAHAGAEVVFLGAVGSDTFALELREALVDAEVDTRLLREVDGTSGVAIITVDAAAENTIVVVGGANSTVTDLTEDELAAIDSADLLMCQLELPMQVVTRSAARARAAGSLVVLNPSPPQTLPDELIDNVDVLIVNESEERALGADVLTRFPHVVVTHGPRGAEYRGPGGARVEQHAFPVSAVDTTGAGDVFAGALAVAWNRGPEHALRWACAAGALATTRPGAGASAPTAAEITKVAT